MFTFEWDPQLPLRPRNFKCGFCDNQVASRAGYRQFITHPPSHILSPEVQQSHVIWIYLCPGCDKPNIFEPDSAGGRQTPGPKPGLSVGHLPDDVGAVFNEARSCLQANAPMATLMVCRKLLIHLASDLENQEKLTFSEAVDLLNKKGHIPTNVKGSVDHIKNVGNEANHEIKSYTRDEAEAVLYFTGSLLTSIYEVSAKLAVLKPKEQH